jgi:hypothetical protein
MTSKKKYLHMKKPILENKINALETHNFAEYFK